MKKHLYIDSSCKIRYGIKEYPINYVTFIVCVVVMFQHEIKNLYIILILHFKQDKVGSFAPLSHKTNTVLSNYKHFSEIQRLHVWF